VKLGLVFGSALFLIAGITLAGNSQEVTGLSDLEITNIAANATANATRTAMDKANAVVSTAANATTNATQAGIEQAKSVMANVINSMSNATSNATRTAMNEANKLISAVAPYTTENTTGKNSSTAQISDNFLNYTNNDMNFSIQYPSNMNFSESKGSKIGKFVTLPEVYFSRPVSPEIVDWLSFDVLVETPQPYLDTDTMTIKNTNTTLDERVQQELNTLQADKNIIRQNEVSVGGNNGTKIEYTSNYYYGFTILTVTNGTVYILSYHDDPLKVPQTLPLANKMVDSFQIK
jgi:hypothetical protein